MSPASQPRAESRKGRLDLAIVAFGQAMSGHFKAHTGIDLWEHGGRELTDEFIRQWGIPSEPINIPMTIAENMGLIDKPRSRRLRRVR